MDITRRKLVYGAIGVICGIGLSAISDFVETERYRMGDKIVVAKGDCHNDISDVLGITSWFDGKGVPMEDLVMIIAGDFGIPWPGDPADNSRKLAKLDSIGCEIVAVLGNHEWWSLVYSMPEGEFCGANVHECVYGGVRYNHIHYVTDPAVMTIDSKDYLLIPGADSHDIRDGILSGLRPIGEMEDKNSWYAENVGEIREFEETVKQRDGYWPQFRIDGLSWWREETIQFDKLEKILESKRRFHAVISHDAPDTFAYEFQIRRSIWDRYPPTEAERRLDKIYRSIDFDYWIHGHFHSDATSMEDSRVSISYFVPHVLSDNFQLTEDDGYCILSY